MKKIFVVLFCLTPALLCHAAVNDDPVLIKLMLHELETRHSDGNTEVGWDVQAWIGRDLDKLWIKTEGARDDGKTSTSEFQALYSRAITAFWDVQIGWRGDAKPARDWVVIGVRGLAPYFIDVDASLFIGGSGASGARLQAERELLVTRRWVLTPMLELNAYSDDDDAAGRGSGLSDLEAALRLHYLFRRNLAPYAGLRWEQTLGDTRSLLRDRGADTSEFQFVIGLNAWF